ncbi:MAG: hypothetical protein OEY28_09315, partial [Nitrospira sp.]|nr:hypothetical protein [Nitrospira sp.]
LVQMYLALTDEQLPGFFPRETLRRTMGLAVSEDHGIDPFAAADTMPIELAKLKHFLLNHQSATTIALIDWHPLSNGESFWGFDHG